MKDNEKNIHEGHRQRVYESFAKDRWLETFSEITTLELLLFIAYPRMDTNVIAHRLLDRFGTLAAVYEAPIKELVKVDGISARIAHFLRLVPAAAKKAALCRIKKSTIKTIPDAIEYLKAHFDYLYNETMYVMCLDATDRVLSVSQISAQGTATSNTISVPAMLQAISGIGGTKVIVAHNHPAGILTPSVEDLKVTDLIVDTLAGLDSVLLDHIIFAPDDSYLSFFDSGIISSIYRDFDTVHGTQMSAYLAKESDHSIKSSQEYIFDIESAAVVKREEYEALLLHKGIKGAIRTRFSRQVIENIVDSMSKNRKE